MPDIAIMQFSVYFSALYDPADVVEVRAIRPKRQGPAPRSQWHTAADWLAGVDREWLATMNYDGWGIYAGVLPRNAPGARGNDNALPGAVAWADIDHVSPAEAGERLTKSQLPHPSMIINSGHGVQCYWLFTERQPTDVLQQINQDIALHIGSDIVVKNPERVMRLPGFTNHKPPVVEAELLELHENLRYDFADFRSIVPAVALPSPAPLFAYGTTLPYSAVRAEKRAWGMIMTKPGSPEGGRNAATYKAAAVLTREFDLSEETALAMIMQWDAEKNSPPIADQKELAAIVVHSRRYGRNPVGCMLAQGGGDDGFDIDRFVNSVPAEVPPADEDPDGQWSQLEQGEPRPYFSHTLLNLSELMDRITEYTLTTSHRMQPRLAMAGSMALQATLAGRQLMDESGTRSNLYILALAGSGGGKERPRKVNDDILTAAGLEHFIGPEEIASDSGLLAELSINPVMLFQGDEIGLMLKQIVNSKGDHLKAIPSLLMKLYTKSSGIYRGKAYADPSRRKIIEYPCLTIYGTSVADNLFDGLTPGSLQDGFFGRLTIIESTERPELIDDVPGKPIPQEIIQIARWWKESYAKFLGNMTDTPGVGGSRQISPRIVTKTGEAKEIYRETIKLIEKAASKWNPIEAALWSRYGEKASKFALIYAASANHKDPVIDTRAMQWACDLADYTTRKMLYDAVRWVSVSAFDKEQKAAIRFIEEEGGSVPAWKLNRKMRHMPERLREEIVRNLLSTRQLILTETKTGGTPKREYKLSPVDRKACRPIATL